MSLLVLDVENTVTEVDGKLDMSPFHANNKLVSVGWTFVDPSSDEIPTPEYVFFHHTEVEPTEGGRDTLQAALDQATLLIGHNIKHDLNWLRESGFTYDGEVYDTAIGEYVLLRGLKDSKSLAESCKRRGVRLKKSELIDKYMDEGITFDRIPAQTVYDYGCADVVSTADLYLAQAKLFHQPDNVGLIPTLNLMNEFCAVLTEMEAAGIAIDEQALDDVAKQYREEKHELEAKLRYLVYEFMGDTPINLSSPEQLSQVIYSRRVNSKEQWKETFNLGTDERGKPLRRPKMSDSAFQMAVRAGTTKLRKTVHEHCFECNGTGRQVKITKRGEQAKNAPKCKACLGVGTILKDLPAYAGLKMAPLGVFDVAVGGFATDKETLERLRMIAVNRGDDKAADFLTAIIRLNAVDTYLDSFVRGIRRGIRNGLIHPKFNQLVTATGRLSSSDPNFQNMPRGKTFPIRKVVVSRFEGGSILEGDAAQLEFRVAGILSGDTRIAADVAEGVDVHSFTADVLTRSGQPTDRQGAKPHTFKPLYGGMSGTEAEVAYYKAFAEKYRGVAEWHKALQEEAILTKRITLPSGRQYAFPKAVRNRYGGAVGQTQIKNYPVQGFATADLIPAAVISVSRCLKEAKAKSVLVNTVHDSIVVDVYPGEEELVTNILRVCLLDLPNESVRRWGYALSIPMGVEIKLGPNWLNAKEVFKG